MNTEKIRIIIADDHQMVRETWRVILELHERVTIIKECASGTEAINASINLKPDIVLIDINTYPMNGFEATKKLLKACPGLYVIGVSVNNQPGYAKNMLQLGAKGYVTKNSDREEMLEAIFTVMDGKTYVCKEVREKMIV